MISTHHLLSIYFQTGHQKSLLHCTVGKTKQKSMTDVRDTDCFSGWPSWGPGSPVVVYGWPVEGTWCSQWPSSALLTYASERKNTQVNMWGLLRDRFITGHLNDLPAHCKMSRTLASLPMTRSLSSTILSLMEDRYLFSMMLCVVLFSPSFTTPPGPTTPTPPPPPPINWHCSTPLGPFAQWVEPGCSCLIGNLSPPPIITGTVVRMLLLISVYRHKAVAAHIIWICFTMQQKHCKSRNHFI